MSDKMSQSEIDELLRSMTSGAPIEIASSAPKKDAKPYDFARPSKFNKDHLRALEIVFDNYSRAITSFLTAYLRTTVHVEVASAEQVTYSEFSNTLSDPVILALLDFSPLKGTLTLEISTNIGYSVIDRILGGPGQSLDKIRDFSEIEKILLERVCVQLVSYIPEAWININEITSKVERIETNSQFAQISSPNEMMALVTLKIKIGSVEGYMNFCIPYIMMEPVINRLNTRLWFSSSMVEDNAKDYSDALGVELEKARLDIRAVIGKTRITVDDFVNLQVGDVITLDSYIDSDLQVLIGNHLKFVAKPGVSRGKNAIQITAKVEKEE